MDSEQTTLSFGQFLVILRRRAPWMLLCVVIGAGAAYGLSKRKTKQYTATAAVAFSNDPLSQQIAGLSSSSAASLSAEQAGNLELLKLGGTAAAAAKRLGHGLSDEAVSSSVSVSAQGESGIFNVAATVTTPTLAAEIANAYASQFVAEQQRANTVYLRSALALVRHQLAALPPPERFGSDGLELVEREHTLSLLAGLGYNSVKLAQEALTPSSPSSPRTKRNTAIGAVLGLLLGLGVALLLERLDRRIREPEELEAIYGLPMLGVVPKSAAFSRSMARDGGRMAPLPATEAEAFGLIRAHLRFFNVDRDVRTLVIASPAPGDGKTTIARHLAEAAARLGSRVLLLETDLRQPTLAQQLYVQSGAGLAGVLIGAVSMDDATQSVALEATPGEVASRHSLDVLVAGGLLPPNPGELLESRAMSALLEQARFAYDLVVIDTPPLTAVSDAFPLLTKVDGVVIVGWVGHSRRDAARQLQQVLAGSGVPLLGIVANGAKVGGPTPYPAADGKLSAAMSSASGSPPSDELTSMANT
jgi:polysaccharide biosynthesis transport protein